VPSQQPTDYLDCKNTGVPNYECCPGGPGDTCASLASTSSPTGGHHPECPFGWTFADGACFKLFGTNESDRKTWPQAEAACRKHGADLATIDSEAQAGATVGIVTTASLTIFSAVDVGESRCSQSPDVCRDHNNDCIANINNHEPARCVPSFAPSHQPTSYIPLGQPNFECCPKLAVAWIGLNDRLEEGAWVWSDGEPLGAVNNWNVGEPTSSNTTQCGAEDCAAMTTAGTNGAQGWADFSCSESLADDGTCVEFRLPYICRKEIAPRTLLMRVQ
jgi:hypothetical protein